MKEFDFLNRDQDPVDKMYIVVLSRTVKIRTGVFWGGLFCFFRSSIIKLTLRE